jgi:hypothetical protein
MSTRPSNGQWRVALSVQDWFTEEDREE